MPVLSLSDRFDHFLKSFALPKFFNLFFLLPDSLLELLYMPTLFLKLVDIIFIFLLHCLVKLQHGSQFSFDGIGLNRTLTGRILFLKLFQKIAGTLLFEASLDFFQKFRQLSSGFLLGQSLCFLLDFL
jgi:hypothetical protein